MTTRLIELIRSLARPKVLVVGDVILDRYVWGRVSRISPEAPIQVLETQREEFRAGGAANVARNLASLGARVILGGTVGDDAWAKILTSELSRDGISSDALVCDGEKPTSTKTRMMAHNHQLLRVDQENVEPIGKKTEQALIEKIRRAAAECDLAIVSDYQKGTLTASVCQALSKLKKPVLVGLKSHDFQKYAGATGATLNRSELRAISGTGDLEAGARQIMKTLKLKFLVVTLGEHGLALFSTGGKPHRMPTDARQVFDVTGAGDTLLSTFGLAYASGLTLEDCARLGNVAAGIVVGKVGTAVATREEMIEHLLGGGHMSDAKIVDELTLVKKLDEERRKGRRIVFTNGCFDLLHVGHIKLLQFARSQGEVLVVALNSDHSVRRLKGPSRPIVPQDERCQIISALESVDYVLLFDENTPKRVIDLVKPDVLVKGEDWADKTVVGSDAVAKRGGRVALAPLVQGSSTSTIITRILERHRNGGPSDKA
jgi:D-beta-D-heptose 7-phosphate kinase/D-beta-D-heptose 1-phosphate adenosyltransferase